MNTNPVESQSLFTVRRRSLFNGLRDVGVVAVLGLILSAIEFNSHARGLGSLEMFAYGVPAMVVVDVCRRQVEKRSLKIDE